MRRWFELGELDDTTYAGDSGTKQFLQLPQKAEFIKWANSMVKVYARLTTGTGDSGLCEGSGSPHLIQHVANVNVISTYGELRGQVMFQGIPPVFEPLCRQYFEKPGVNDGPNDTQTVEKPRGGSRSGRGAGTIRISLKSYLLLLLNTWGGGVRYKSGQFLVQPAPQRWIEWLTLLINHYDRYTPSQIYGFLGRVDFTGPTFKV